MVTDKVGRGKYKLRPHVNLGVIVYLSLDGYGSLVSRKYDDGTDVLYADSDGDSDKLRVFYRSQIFRRWPQ